MTNQPQVLVTGRHWIGVEGSRSIGSVIVEMMSEAQQEIIIVAYRLTVSVVEFLEVLEKALSRGCYVRIIRNVGEVCIPTEEAYLEKLISNYKTLTIWNFKEDTANHTGVALHAKMVIVDRSIAVVGSANFSRNGMIENHEIAIRLSGHEVKSLAAATDKLVENGQKDGVLCKK